MDEDLPRYIAQQLYYKSPKWLALQAEAYGRGENLLTKTVFDWFPHIRLPRSAIGFAQIQVNLNSVYQDFDGYYARVKDKRNQVLYPPVIYLKKYILTSVGKWSIFMLKYGIRRIYYV
jgi:competence protein CoiA